MYIEFMKGQVSVEMLIVIGLGITLVGIYAIYGYASVDSYKKGNDDSLIKDSLEKVAETSRFVALQGSPARQKINICFPLSFNNCSISGSTISCLLTNGQTIDQDAGTAVNGTLPKGSGCWDVVAEAQDNFVNLSVI